MSSPYEHERGLLSHIAQQQLLAIQNHDGGWGFRPGQKSAVEPASLALLAHSQSHDQDRSAQQQAIEFLRRTQLQNGGWPNVIGDERGGWVTALGCLALNAVNGSTPEVNAAAMWLASSWPGEGGAWWRLRHHIFGQSHLVSQDHKLRGWSWTPGTSSWVEPTACALLALRRLTASPAFLNRVNQRRNLAERMLCDRVCPGGGWNSGNPIVYGAAGRPAVGPTCWALFALAELADHETAKRAIDDSLTWLETIYPYIQGTISHVMAHVCLRVFGRQPNEMYDRLNESRDWFNDVPALAWVCLSGQSIPHWLSPQKLRTN